MLHEGAKIHWSFPYRNDQAILRHLGGCCKHRFPNGLLRCAGKNSGNWFSRLQSFTSILSGFAVPVEVSFFSPYWPYRVRRIPPLKLGSELFRVSCAADST